MPGTKILLTTHPTAFLASGGGELELAQICRTLEMCGFEADIYGPDSHPLNYYDAVMHFSARADGMPIVQTAKRFGSKIISWPNTWWNETPSFQEVNEASDIVQSASAVLFKSGAERQNFRRFVQCDAGEKDLIVPTLVTWALDTSGDPELLRTVVRFESYVLNLGRIEPIKNQLEAIRVCSIAGVPLAIVGPIGDQRYYERCLREAGPDVQFIPLVAPQSQLLASLFQGCLGVCELSHDPPGRSSLEAALFRKPLLLADGEWQQEVYGETVNYWNPGENEISAASSWLRNPDFRTQEAFERVYKMCASQSAVEAFCDAVSHAVYK